MQKKYIVRLSDEERQELDGVVKKLAGTSSAISAANIAKVASTANGDLNASPKGLQGPVTHNALLPCSTLSD